MFDLLLMYGKPLRLPSNNQKEREARRKNLATE